MKCASCNKEHSYWNLIVIPLLPHEIKQDPQPVRKLVCENCIGWPLSKEPNDPSTPLLYKDPSTQY